MSNLLKGFYVALDDSEKRVIDSNEIISEKLVHLKSVMTSDEFSADGFSAGLNVADINDVIEEGDRIIGDNESVEEDDNIPAHTESVVKKEIIIAEAQAEADQIVARAQEDANSIIEKAMAEAEQIRAQASENGYNDGFAKGSEDSKASLDQALAELEQQKNQIISEYRKKEEEMEPALVDKILQIFADITNAVSVDKRDMILTLVNNVMAGVEVSRDFIIKVSPEDAQFLKENREKIIGAVRKDIHIEIVADSTMKKNQCYIDTDTGVYDCSLDIQLENLINDIRILSATGE